MTIIAALITVFSPLIGAALAGFGDRWLNDQGSQRVTIGLIILATLASFYVFNQVVFEGQYITYKIFTWIQSDGFDVSWGLQLDTLTVVMLSVVTLVSTTVHIYSIGYMKHDKSIPRFMSYLSLFTFFMLALVSAPNLLQMFFGWEGVGLASYLLIGFWYDKPAANAAAIKAFLVNRVGDIGFVLGIFTIFYIFNTIQFNEFLYKSPLFVNTSVELLGWDLDAITLACLFLFIGAMGKSAQLGLHTWLPDAMEGPTPVSALIHAATMVTAGVFMIARLSPMLEYAPIARDVIIVVGAATALFAATVACTQFDIKRIIAYSTCSQLGYMFMAAGASAYGASVFHLTTHAFFKAMLFLGAGSVIHAMSDEHDIRRMGGIWSLIPITYTIMWIGSLSLAGFPLFSGYYSKDIILESLWGSGHFLGQMGYIVGVAVVVLTAFYSLRLLFVTFHGKPRADEMVMSHVHESPTSMLVPLYILAIGSIFSGFAMFDWLVGEGRGLFWASSLFVLAENDTIEAAHHTNIWVKLTPLAAAIIGVGLAFLMYISVKWIPGLVTRILGPIYTFTYNKWYFDELYNAMLVNPAKALGRLLWIKGDKATIDGFGPDGMSNLSLSFGALLCRLQSGYLYHYAFAMIIGLALMMGWYFWILG